MNFSDLIGHTIMHIEGCEIHSAHVTLWCSGVMFELKHSPDCCESVQVVEIHGDVADLIGSPVLEAEEVENPPEAPPYEGESGTWTFYKLATFKGRVTIRWLGESNGYYSEAVTTYGRKLEMQEYSELLDRITQQPTEGT